MLELESVRMEFPSDTNIIVGQSHFIKTVEDLYEAVVAAVPQPRFGLAFNEASGPCLVRSDGNDDELTGVAIRNAQAVGAGHVFVLVVRNAYPINLLKAIRNVDEVCSIFCATANPLEVVVARSEQGRHRPVSRGNRRYWGAYTQLPFPIASRRDPDAHFGVVHANGAA